MKMIQFKVILISGLVFCALLLILTAGFWPWVYGGLSEMKFEHYKKVLTAATPSFELGTLTGDPYFLKQPISHLMTQTSADYLAVYNIKGTTLVTTPQDKETDPINDDFFQALLKDGTPKVIRQNDAVDFYVPIWGQIPLDQSIDETQIFFPKEETAQKEDQEGSRYKVLGILRMGISSASAGIIPLPLGKEKVYLILALAATALILFYSYWWALYKRLKPFHRGVNLLSKGNYNYRIPRQQAAELSYLADGINNMAMHLEQLSSKIDQIAADPSRSDIAGWPEGLANKLADELASPAGFLFMNLYKLLEYITSILKVLNAYNSLKLNSQEAQNLEELKQDTEYDHIIEDVERLVRSCIKAIDKIKKVSSDLKKLSSSDQSTPMTTS
jgi:HAMP domain-containing protein